jgi:hypothetical protein
MNLIEPYEKEKGDPLSSKTYENNQTRLASEFAEDEVRLSKPIWSSFFTLLGLLVFNFYPQIVAFAFATQHRRVIVPAFAGDFAVMLPWINIIWVLTLILNISLIRERRWTPFTRWFEIGLKTAGVVIAYIFITGPSISAIPAQSLQATHVLNSRLAKTVADMVNISVDIAIAIAVIFGGIEVVRDVYKALFRARRPKPLDGQ